MITALTIFLVVPVFVSAVTDNQIKSAVQIICPTNLGYSSSGSGTIIRGDGIILTNNHVVEDANGPCKIGIATSSALPPSFLYTAKIVSVVANFDIALLAINEKKDGFPFVNIDTSRREPKLGEKIEILGYPSIGGSTISFSSGYAMGQVEISSDYTSNPYKYIKTDAFIEFGNSGGGAFYEDGIFAGIPTAVVIGKARSVGYITPAVLVHDFIEFKYRGSSGIPNDSKNYIVADVASGGAVDFNIPKDMCDMNIYSDSSKSQILSCFDLSSRGTRFQTHTDSTPYFEWSTGYHPSGIAGYYVYFGINKNADPIKDGIYLSFDSNNIGGSQRYRTTVTEFSPKQITENGTYYLMVTYKSNSGHTATIPSGIWTYPYYVSSQDLAKQKTISDGTLIKSKENNDVYIVKIIGNKKFKRLVLNPSVFNSYGHLHWNDIIEVTQDTVESFQTSNLVRATVAGDPKVYLLYPESANLEEGGGDSGIKRWIVNEQVFSNLGLDWDEIYTINETDRNSYTEVESLS